MDIQFYSFNVICFLLFMLLQGAICDHCTQRDVDKCWEPVDNYMQQNGYDPDHTEFALFHMAEQHLRGYCHIYMNSTSHCLADLKPHCTYEERKLFQGLEEAEDFFCGEGFDDYIRHKDCIGADTTQSKLHDCIDDFESDYYDLLYTSNSVSELEDRFCDAVYDSIDCDKDAVKELCGEEAAEWVETYQTKLYDPIMEQFNCQRGSSTPLQTNSTSYTLDNHLTGIIVGVIVAVCALVIISCIVTCIIHQKKQRQLQSRGQQASNAMVFYNNGMAANNGQPQVGFGATPGAAEKAGMPPAYQLETPSNAGVYTQPAPPPAYSSPPPSVLNDKSSVAYGSAAPSMQPQSATSHRMGNYQQPPPQYGSDVSSNIPQYERLN